MPIAVTGSVATDHLMSYRGTFKDSLVVDQLDKISLSFLVDDLQIRRGGCAANIAFGLGMLGERPLLIAAVGADFAGYRSWLERHGVDCSHVLYSATRHTARFVCTTDEAHAQIASFYTGAMAEARMIELAPIAASADGFPLVVVAPNDPDAMIRHTEECRARGYPFAADPSQQLAIGTGEQIRRLVDQATYLLTNEYEAALTEQKTGWSSDDILGRVGTRVTTLGPAGCRVERAGAETVTVEAVPGVTAVEPTGVGDAFRAGFLGAVGAGQSLQTAAQVGCVLAAYVVETVGTQEYEFTRQQFVDRLGQAYGEPARAASAGWLLGGDRQPPATSAHA